MREEHYTEGSNQTEQTEDSNRTVETTLPIAEHLPTDTELVRGLTEEELNWLSNLDRVAEMVRAYRGLDGNETVNLYHQTRDRLADVQKIMHGHSLGVMQYSGWANNDPFNNVTFAVYPVFGDQEGVVLKVPRNEIAFEGEDRAGKRLAIDNEGFVGILGKQRERVLSYADYDGEVVLPENVGTAEERHALAEQLRFCHQVRLESEPLRLESIALLETIELSLKRLQMLYLDSRINNSHQTREMIQQLGSDLYLIPFSFSPFEGVNRLQAIAKVMPPIVELRDKYKTILNQEITQIKENIAVKDSMVHQLQPVMELKPLRGPLANIKERWRGTAATNFHESVALVDRIYQQRFFGASTRSYYNYQEPVYPQDLPHLQEATQEIIDSCVLGIATENATIITNQEQIDQLETEVIVLQRALDQLTTATQQILKIFKPESAPVTPPA